MAKKFDAKELTESIRLHVGKGLAIAMQAGLTSMVERLDKGQSVDGGSVKAYSPNYDKDYARRRALGGKLKAAKTKGEKKQNSAGTVDWLLTGAMRRGFTVLDPKRIKNGWEIVLTVLGGHYSGKSKADILRYNIEKRPNFWGFSKKNMEAFMNALKAYFKSINI